MLVRKVPRVQDVSRSFDGSADTTLSGMEYLQIVYHESIECSCSHQAFVKLETGSQNRMSGTVSDALMDCETMPTSNAI